MWKNRFEKLNEWGSLMVEAMAMLALISMVTPILYKKAAERTTELQDINAASQVRSIIKAVDDFAKDNYDKLVVGDSVTNSAGTSQSFANLKNDKGKVTVPITFFRDYLPYGFLDKDGKVQDSKTFSKDYQVVLKKTDKTDASKGLNIKSITAFLITKPKEGSEFPMLRASRIASMVGSNGGYALNNVGNGVQGIWTISDIKSELGVTATDGAVIASSVQPIASAGGGENENYLYRTSRPGRKELNQMETDLYLGGVNSMDHNIRNVNQLIITASQIGHMAEAGQGANGALMLTGSAGAYINGTLSAMMGTADQNFTVNSEGMKYGALFQVTPSNLLYGESGKVVKASASDVNLLNGKVTVDSGGTKMTDLVKMTGTAVVGGETVTSGSNFTVQGNADVTGTLTAGEVKTPKFKSQQLYAGVDANYLESTANLHVTNSLATFSKTNLKVGDTSDPKLDIQATNTDLRNTTVNLYGGGTASSLALSPNAVLSSTGAGQTNIIGGNSVNIYTSGVGVSNVADEVSIQNNMLRANSSTVEIDSAVNAFTVKNSDATVYAQTDISSRSQNIHNMNLVVRDGSSNYVLKVEPQTANKGKVKVDGELTVFNDNAAGDSGSRLFQVSQASNNAAGNPTMHVIPGAVTFNATNDADMGNGITGKKVLVVDNDFKYTAAADKGSVYVRRGVVELASNTGSKESDEAGITGYMKADRFVSNKALDAGALKTANSVNEYKNYQINPAYTSVMHDIKLTTRGGARLSDILPDFINKGIYVVDNTYLETFGSWESPSGCPNHTSGNSCQTVADSYVAKNHTDWTSPWLGVVPSPICPPGYAKVVTITPAGFAMAQAGIPGTRADTTSRQDIVLVTYPKSPHDDYSTNPADAPMPLYFQKSTWLRAKVYAHGSGDNFKGWSAIMGFMYPYTYYKKYMEEVGAAKDKSSSTIAWNLFPVFKNQLEAYATVYCYFDRLGKLGTTFNDDLVDKYDQLNSFRAPNTKTEPYSSRLNDPTLNYNDPW